MERPALRKDLDDSEHSYLKEMLTHPANFGALCSSVIAGSATLVFSGVAPLALVPVVGYLGLAAVASLFVPDSPIFREYIRRRKGKERRELSRSHLREQIDALVPRALPEGHASGRKDWRHEYRAYWPIYDRLRQRFAQLAHHRAAGTVRISPYDLDRLDDATLDFLRLFHARLLIRQRLMSIEPGQVQKEIDRIGYQLEHLGSSDADALRLERARDDLRALLDRHRSLIARDTSAAASLASMADTFEEVFQRLATGSEEGVSEFLHGAAERLQIEEDLALEVEAELGEVGRKARPQVAAASRVAARN